MGFKKGSFLVLLKDPSYRVEVKTGWIKDGIGYYKNATGWVATDLISGLSIAWDKTRAGVEQKVENLREEMKKARTMEMYIKQKAIFDSMKGE